MAPGVIFPISFHHLYRAVNRGFSLKHVILKGQATFGTAFDSKT
jgi:hypothetical protein